MTRSQDTTTLWLRDESLASLPEILNEQPRHIRVISFDFFDTLISRLCAEPPDLFLEVGRRLLQRGLLRRKLQPVEFRVIRVASDERARKLAVAAGRCSEITLADIYRQLDPVVTNRAAALGVEMETERDFCYLNPSTASLLAEVRKLGFKTALISDTYFTREQILTLMQDNEIAPDLFDQILISNEQGAAKWNGSLFREAFACFDIHPSELLHIGDNRHADVFVPRQLGVDALHYHRTTPFQDNAYAWERALRGSGEYPAASTNSLRVLAARLCPEPDDAYRDGSFVFGPVLARYSDWCVTQFQAAGVTTVLALMREGELLGELVQNSAQAAGVKFKVIPCFVSRMSTARAAMAASTCEQIEEQFEGHQGLTPETILQVLGLATQARQFLSAELLAKPLGSGENVRGFLRQLTDQPGLCELIERERTQAHQLAFDYLTSLIGDETVIGVIDLGWSGSIQRNISRILRLGGRDVRTVGCYLATTPRAGRLYLEGDEVRAYLDPLWNRCTILPEVAITACFGSTDRYTRAANGRVEPVLGAFQSSSGEVQIKSRIRQGILGFQHLWLQVLHQRPNRSFTPAMMEDIDGQAGSILLRLLEFPGQEEAERLGALSHDENFFGVRYNHPLCDAASEAHLRRGGIHSLFAQASCYWPQGVVARVHPQLLAGLASRWQAPQTLGRLGSLHSDGQTVDSLTSEEMASLRDLLRDLHPQQVVVTGSLLGKIVSEFGQPPSLGPASAAMIAGTPFGSGTNGAPISRWIGEGQTIPYLITFGRQIAAGIKHESGYPRQHVAGDPGSLETLRAVRLHLRPCIRIALVLSDDLPITSGLRIVNYLGPFLGPKGIVLASRGRHSPPPFTDPPLIRALREWHEATGAELGFDPWNPGTGCEVDAQYWSVFLRGGTSREPAAHWSLTLADWPELGSGLGTY